MKTPHRKKTTRTAILPDVCPSCEQQFEFQQQQIVETIEDKTVTHGQCSVCHGGLLVFQYGAPQSGSSAIALLTDLTYYDVCAYWAADRITQDNVLEMHTLLQKGTAFERSLYEQKNR